MTEACVAEHLQVDLSNSLDRSITLANISKKRNAICNSD